MSTVGISVVRGVVLAAGPPGIVLHSLQRPLHGGAVGAAITGVLDGAADESGNDAEGGDDAIVYQAVSERRAIVSQLTAGKWASSQVSDGSELAVLAREEHGLELFETVRVLEIVDGQTLFLLVGPARDTVSAAGARAY